MTELWSKFSAAWDALKFGVPSSAGLVGAFFGAGQIAAVAGISVLAPVATIGLLVNIEAQTVDFYLIEVPRVLVFPRWESVQRRV